MLFSKSLRHVRLLHRVKQIVLIAAIAWFGLLPSHGNAVDLNVQRLLVNKSVVGVMGDGARGTDFAMIADLAAVLDQGYELRILPMAGTGSVRAIEDLLLLRGVDVALVQADVLDFYKKADLFPDIDEKVRYLATLYNKEFHLLARTDIRSITDLNGKKVNFGPASSGSFLTASLIFQTMGIDVEVSDDDYQVALGKLLRGEIDAWVRVDAKPTLQLEDVSSEDGVHFLPFPGSAIHSSYDAAQLTSKDYPGLIRDSATVQTLSVPTVMAVYAWSPQHKKTTQLKALYDGLARGMSTLQQPPFHQKWREVDLSSEIDGWTRN